jgi:16S rRNA processing protein RimM
MVSDQLVVIGRLGRPHGVLGEIRAHPTGPTLPALCPGDRVTVVAADGDTTRELEIRQVRPASGSLLIRFAGTETREAAAALTGATIGVPADRRATLTDPGEYYVTDLIGCIVASGGLDLGPVVDVYEGSANDSLVVRAPDGDELLVPFTHDAVVDVDLAAGRIRVRDNLMPESDGR